MFWWYRMIFIYVHKKRNVIETGLFNNNKRAKQGNIKLSEMIFVWHLWPFKINSTNIIKNIFERRSQCYEDEQYCIPCPSLCTQNKRWNEILQNTQKAIFLLRVIYFFFPLNSHFVSSINVFHLSRMMYDCKLIDSVHNSYLVWRERVVWSKLISIAECMDIRYET